MLTVGNPIPIAISFQANGKVIVTFKRDGTIEAGDSVTADEASSAILNSLRFQYATLFAEAIAREREACAKIADEAAVTFLITANDIAAAIRARSYKKD